MLIGLVGSAKAQDHRGHRFSVSVEPGISFLKFNEFPVLHNRLSIGMVLGKQLELKAQYLNTTNTYDHGTLYSIRTNDVAYGLSILVYIRNNGAIAPVGRFIGAGIYIGTQNDNYIYSHSEGVEKVSLAVVTSQFGRNFLFKTRFKFGYGIEWGLSLLNTKKIYSRYLIKPTFTFGFMF